VVGVFSGVIFAGGFGFVVRGITPPKPSWVVTVVVCLGAGALFGVTMAVTIGKQRRALRAAAGELPAGELAVALRAATWGALPAAPRVRAAAASIAKTRVLKIRKARPLYVIAAVIFFALGVANTLSGHYVAAALDIPIVLLATSELYQLKRLPPRIAQLTE
jgi:hypothetical protein